MSTSNQRLALAICDHLSTCVTNGTLSAEDKDPIDVAISCISEAFNVDPNDKAAVSAAIGNQNLAQIFSVFEKTKDGLKGASSGATFTASSSATANAGAPPTEEQKKEAEALKSRGNAAMAQRDYKQAIDLYTQALARHPGNAIFLSNRAAAYSAARDQESARADAEAAVAADPTYTKAWSRLGLARFALGDARGAMEAYKAGIDAEGNGGSDAMKKGYETAKRRVEEVEGEGTSASSRDLNAGAGAGGIPNLNDLAGMFGGGAGRGGSGGGGMPDLNSIMSNPMFANMAQNLMSNPDTMANLMSNPRLREMANQFTSGGGMPDISSLMSDPNIAEMARSMMGGAGRGAGAGPGADGAGR